MKDIAEARARTRGLFNITVTPFSADGAPDLAALAENIERVLGLGFDGILYKVTIAVERDRVVAVLERQAADRPCQGVGARRLRSGWVADRR